MSTAIWVYYRTDEDGVVVHLGATLTAEDAKARCETDAAERPLEWVESAGGSWDSLEGVTITDEIYSVEQVTLHEVSLEFEGDPRYADPFTEH